SQAEVIAYKFDGAGRPPLGWARPTAGDDSPVSAARCDLVGGSLRSYVMAAGIRIEAVFELAPLPQARGGPAGPGRLDSLSSSRTVTAESRPRLSACGRA